MHPGAPSCSFNACPILPSCMLDVCSFLRSEKAYKAKSQSSPQQHFGQLWLAVPCILWDGSGRFRRIFFGMAMGASGTFVFF